LRNIFKSRAALVLIVVVAVLGISIGIINASGIKITFLENTVNVIISPVQKLISVCENGVGNFFGYFSDVDAVREENSALKEENKKLENELRVLQATQKENDSLRGLLGLKMNLTQFNLECSQVIGRDPGNWFSTITVDKGSADGILIDQAVVTSNNALVGRVFEVGSNWSKIVTIMDPECSVGTMIERSGDYGVTEGDAALENEGKCKLSYISKSTNILVGDMLMTSGLGGIFPKGLLVGKVQSVQTDVQGISQYAVVVPECNFNKLEYVFIIKDEIK